MSTSPHVPFKTRATLFFQRQVKPYLTPYYLTVAGVLGLATVGFVAVIALLLLVSTNFNLLGWME